MYRRVASSLIPFETFFHSFEGIRNTTTVFDSPKRDRIRLVNFLESRFLFNRSFLLSSQGMSLQMGYYA